MGDALNALSGKLGIDTSDFKTGVAAANRELRVLESGFRASVSTLGDWSKSATGLEERISTLTKSIDVQKGKVEATREEWERVKDANGENSRAAQELEIKLNKETETLGRLERELGDTDDALKDMGKEADDAGKDVKEMGEDSKNTGSKLVDLSMIVTGLNQALELASKAFNLVKRAVEGMISVIRDTVGPASDLNETISKTEVVFGDSADKVKEFGETAATTLGMSEQAALAAAGTYGNLLRATGLTEEASADMSIGLVGLASDLASFNNMDPTEVLDKLRAGLTGEAEPLKVLGVNMNAARLEAKALDMGLIKQGEELDAAAKAQAAYAIMMEDTALAQGDFARTSDGLANQQRIMEAQFENIKATIGTAFLPMITEGAGAINEFMQSAAFTEGLEELVGWIERLGGIFGTLFENDFDISSITDELTSFVGDALSRVGELASELTGVIVELMPEIMPEVLGFVSTMASGLASMMAELLPELLPVVVDLITMLVDFIVQNLPLLVEVAIQMFETILTTLLGALPQLIEAAIQIILTLVQGITQMLPTLIPTIARVLVTIVQTIIENLPLLIEAALQLILALVNGIVAALPILIESLPVLVQALVEGIIQASPQLLTAAVQILLALVGGIVQNLPLLVTAAVGMVKAIIDTLVKTDWKSLGTQIVKGVEQGWQTAWEGFKANIVANFTAMIDFIKKLLGIASPSKVFGVIGMNMALGLGDGFLAQFARVQSDLGQAFQGMTLAPAGGGLAGSGSYTTQSESYAFYAPVTFSEGAAGLGETLKSKRF